ncbi:MAG: TatD family hydrolase [Desulfurococcaceae archaeon]
MFYSDAHLHVNPVSGLGAEKIAKKFRNKDGWFISIIALPPHHYGYTEPSVESYRKTIELLNREAIRAREQGLQVSRFIGIHPAEIDYYYKYGISADKLMKLIDEVLKLFEQSVINNLVDGIGEVGRQHYGTSNERLVFSEIVMVKAMNLARDHGIPIQLHLEQGGFATVYSIKLISGLLGIHSDKVIIHHSNIETAYWAEYYEHPFTAPVRYFNEKYASIKWRRCMIESDFIDDPQRPGVSAYPWEIPEVLGNLVEKGVINEEQAYKIQVDNIVKYFGVSYP